MTPDYVSLTSIKRYADDNRIAVVMPCGYNSFYTDSATGPRYWQYVSEELPQVCQTLLPLSAKREDNFVAGLSMGGFGAMKMGLMRPEHFAAVLCMSGASINPDKIHDFPRRRPTQPESDGPQERRGLNLDVIFGDKDAFKGGPHDMYYRAAENVRECKPLPRFYFTVGDQDFALEHVVDAEAHLTSLGYDVFCEVVPGYGHEWPFWDLSLKKALDEWLPIRREVMYRG